MSDLGPDELVASWARVGAELRAALAGVTVSDQVGRWVLEFLDANELGLAFQTLVEALAEARADVSEGVLGRLALASREMGLEADPGWRRLTERPDGDDEP